MAYQTGTINNVTDFPPILDAFLLANGWTKVNNSVAINLTAVTYNGTNGAFAGLTYASNALANVPLGASLSWTGKGSAKVVLNSKLANGTTGQAIYDSAFTSISSSTSVTFSWTTYNKGTKYVNFETVATNTTSPTASSQNILFDLYHTSSGAVSTITNKIANACRFEPGLSQIPCTYQLFLNTNPDMVTGVFTFGQAVSHFHVGDLVKLHTSAYVGGEFLVASSEVRIATSSFGASMVAETALSVGLSAVGNNGAIFCDTIASSNSNSGMLHVEIDGIIYSATASTAAASVATLTQNTLRKYFRGLNNWNQQALLVVPELQFNAASSFYMYLGYIEHLRLIRVDNYNVGDTITLGSDQWKVYPLAQKNASIRNPAGGASLTGTLGFAVRYTP